MITVGAVEDIPEGEAVRLDGETPIAVFKVDGALYAIDDTCTHQDASLSEGWVEDCAVECPLHAACFDLRTGQVSGPPARRPVRTHEILVVEDVVYVQPSWERVGYPGVPTPQSAPEQAAEFAPLNGDAA